MIPHQSSLEEITRELNTDAEKGLSSEAAAQRLEEFGPNAIRSQKRRSPWLILLHQFKSPVVYLLLAAAGVSLFFEEWLDAIAIGIVILLNAVIGFIMELQAERSMEALQQLTTQTAKVIRSGRLREIGLEEIVPGDMMVMEAGDMVPADGRIVEARDLQVDESALTGESVPSPRSTRPGCTAAIVPNCSATSSGGVLGICTAPEPTRIVDVAAASSATSTGVDADARPGLR